MRNLLGFIALAAATVGAVPAVIGDGQFVMGGPSQEHVLAAEEPLMILPAPIHTETYPSIETNQTIYIYLSQQLRYTKLVKLIDFDETYVTILNSTTDSVTFFAPDNKALTPPKRRNATSTSLAHAYEEYERLFANDEDGGGDDDEERKKIFKKILHALLKYHTLPAALNREGFSTDRTYATALKAKDGSYGGQPRRISVSSALGGRFLINEYVWTEGSITSTANGYIYGISRPIFPPPSIIDELFMSDNFATLTSALQKVGLDDKLQWRWKWKTSSETEGDGPVVSLFAPTDFAFKRLPWRLRIWLFSPAGEKVLKKLLKFHIVPEWVLHSDWVYNATSDDLLKQSQSVSFEDCDAGDDWYRDLSISPRSRRSTTRKCKCRLRRKSKGGPSLLKSARPEDTSSPFFVSSPDNEWPGHHHPPNVTVNLTIPTLLEDHSLNFVVIKPPTSKKELKPMDLPPFAGVSTEGEGKSGESDPPTETNLPFPFHWRSIVLVNGVPTIVEAVARNGALYGINRLLHPRKPQEENDVWGMDGRWDDWEEWLPAWGEE